MKVWLLRIYYLLLGFGVQVYFRRIYLSGFRHIPPGGPIWLNSSHSNAFLDSILLGLFSKRSLWYLARSDVFKNPVVAKVLNAHGLLPIYRLEEGFQGLSKNEETFATCYKKFAEGQAITIYPEGNCIRESRLRPLKKGSARIVQGLFQYEPFRSKKLPVSAVGLNYDFPDKFGSDLHVCISEPMEAADFFMQPGASSSASILAYTRQLAVQMDESHLNLVHPDASVLFYFLKRHYSDMFFDGFDSADADEKTATEFFRKQKKLANRLNRIFSHEDSEEKNRLCDAVSFLRSERIHEGFEGEGYWQAPMHLLWILPAMLLLFPIALLSLPVFLCSFYLARRIVKLPEFFSSVNLPGGVFIGLVYYVLLATGVYKVFGSFAFTMLFIPTLIAAGLLFLDARKKAFGYLRDLEVLLKMREPAYRKKADAAIFELRKLASQVNSSHG